MHTGFLLVMFLMLKEEVTCSSEMSVDFQQTTWHSVPKDRPPQNVHFILRIRPLRNHVGFIVPFPNAVLCVSSCPSDPPAKCNGLVLTVLLFIWEELSELCTVSNMGGCSSVVSLSCAIYLRDKLTFDTRSNIFPAA
jgi:hypothetical protein